MKQHIGSTLALVPLVMALSGAAHAGYFQDSGYSRDHSSGHSVKTVSRHRHQDQSVAVKTRHRDRDESRHSYTWIDKRQQRQRHRIRQGIHNGSLTRKEVKRLRRDQRKIARLEQKFLEDGKLTKKERRILKRRLDRASDRIYREKHDQNRRWDKDYSGVDFQRLFFYQLFDRDNRYSHHW